MAVLPSWQRPHRPADPGAGLGHGEDRHPSRPRPRPHARGDTLREVRAYRQTPIFRHPFFRKQCFSLKYSFVSPPQKVSEECLNSEYI
jgi:hypothetical protein